jgi:DNA-binding response OmpR family regulator
MMPIEEAQGTATPVTGRPTHLLVAEDDPANRYAAVHYLRRRGYRVTECADGPDVLRQLVQDPADAVLLDLGLPGVDGLDILTTLRREQTTPVIICTARAAERDRITGLDLGADDYLVKPFSLPELESRIRAVLRRSRPVERIDHISADGLVIDRNERTVTVDGAPVELTRKEFDLLAFLATRPGHVHTRESILEQVWGSTEAWQNGSTVTEHVRRIRLKVEADPNHPRYITTVRGVGYRFERDPAAMRGVA